MLSFATHLLHQRALICFVPLFRCTTDFVEMSVTLVDVDKVHEALRPSGLRGMIARIAAANGLRGTIQLARTSRGFGDMGNPEAGHRNFDLLVQGRAAGVAVLVAALEQAEVRLVPARGMRGTARPVGCCGRRLDRSLCAKTGDFAVFVLMQRDGWLRKAGLRRSSIPHMEQYLRFDIVPAAATGVEFNGTSRLSRENNSDVRRIYEADEARSRGSHDRRPATPSSH